MVYQPYYYHPYYDESINYFHHSYSGNIPYQSAPVKNVTFKINEYFFKALFYIKKILDILLQTSPIFEQYGPIIQELPKMYHLMKAINEASFDDEEVHILALDYRHDGPPPTLYI